MDIYVNEKLLKVKNTSKVFEIRNKVKPDADVVILNGFMIQENLELKNEDRLVLIKRREKPSKDELEHLLVSRHTPGVHKKVKKACVGIAGLGGLGSNIAISLARLGIGRLILIDFDVVEPSNLNRQQYFVKHIGMYKTEAMKELIKEINPYVKVETKNIYLDRRNIKENFSEASIIVEAFDNPKCKAELINTVLSEWKEKYVIAASGVAGCFSNNTIKTRRVRKKFYIVGDETHEAKPGCGLMSPRVAIAANHQANTVLRILLGEEDV